jgi:hypothetical protein
MEAVLVSNPSDIVTFGTATKGTRSKEVLYSKAFDGHSLEAYGISFFLRARFMG